MTERQVPETVPGVTGARSRSAEGHSLGELLGRALASRLVLCAATADFIVIAAVNLMAALLYQSVVLHSQSSLPMYVVAALSFATAFCAAAGLGGRYALRELETASMSVVRGLKLFNVLFAVFVCLLFLTKGTTYYSRASLALQYVSGSACLALARIVMAQLVHGGMARGWVEARRVAIVGPRDGWMPYLASRSLAARGVIVTNAFAVPDWNGEPLTSERAAEMDELAARLTSTLRRSNVDDILIVMPWRAASLIEIFVRRLSALPAHVHLASDPELTFLRAPAMAQIGDQVTLSLSRPPLSALDRGVKRAFDIACASLILLATAPLMLVIALAIKLDSAGPILFRQQRHGFNQKPFRILKFRTMTTLDDGAVIVQACKGDARVTRIGRVLRRTSLDELPQLLNVLRGDMSLVGPRPHALAHDREYEEKIALYAHRHNVKPGITGWAQVHGFRGETDVDWKMQKRVEFDLAYIDRWSLLLDIQILFLTIFSRKTFTNAH